MSAGGLWSDNARGEGWPWRFLVRAGGPSFAAAKIVLAGCGLLLHAAGWSVLREWLGVDRAIHLAVPGLSLWPPSHEVARSLLNRVAEPYRLITEPGLAVFRPSSSAREILAAILAIVWSVLVWGIFGTAIGRIAAVERAAYTRLGVFRAVGFALKRRVALFVPPLSPLLFVALFYLVLFPFGAIYRIVNPTADTIGAVFHFIPLLVAVPMALALLGLAAGWPLFSMTVAIEDEDGFDALSRTYSYVRLKLWRYLAYTVCLWILGAACLAIVELFATVVTGIAAGAVRIGATDRVYQGVVQGTHAASGIHGFWTDCVRFAVTSWIYAYFWTAASVVFCLVRRDVDGVDLDDVGGLESEGDSGAKRL
jgi:hypothetical protein